MYGEYQGARHDDFNTVANSFTQGLRERDDRLIGVLELGRVQLSDFGQGAGAFARAVRFFAAREQHLDDLFEFAEAPACVFEPALRDVVVRIELRDLGIDELRLLQISSAIRVQARRAKQQALFGVFALDTVFRNVAGHLEGLGDLQWIGSSVDGRLDWHTYTLGAAPNAQPGPSQAFGRSLAELSSGMRKFPQVLLNVKVAKRFDPSTVPSVQEAVLRAVAAGRCELYSVQSAA